MTDKLKKVLKNLSESKLNESSLSRLWSHNEKYDCGAMTAFRNSRDCGEGAEYTKKENRQRNRKLSAQLRSLGYGVTKVHGKYPEGGRDGKEESFFIVDLKDTGNLERDLMKLGEEYEQDSILFIPKGSIQGDDKAYLMGTNHCPKNDIKYHEKFTFNKGRLGYDSPIYTTFVSGRPFIFEEVGLDLGFPNSGFGVWAMHLVSKKPWQELDVED